MTGSGEGHAALAAALAAAEDLMALPGVEGVGQGEDGAGAPVVLVLCAGVTDALRASIPAELGGIPVVLYDIGERPTAQPIEGWPYDDLSEPDFM